MYCLGILGQYKELTNQGGFKINRQRKKEKTKLTGGKTGRKRN